MLTALEKQTKLARLKNRHTRYEIIAAKGEQKVLVGYTARKGHSGLYAMLSGNAESWGKFAGNADPRIHFRKPASEGADSEGWHIHFSGRTQRDAICNGELPFFPTLIGSKEVACIPVPSGKL